MKDYYDASDENTAPKPVLKITCLADVESKPVEWTWKDHIPKGKLTILGGLPGVGKSLAALDFAARVSNGWGWPDNPKATKAAGKVLILASEDDRADTIKPRLEAMGANFANLFIVDGIADEQQPDDVRDWFTFARDADLLPDNLDVLILDHLKDFISAETEGEKAKRAIRPVADWAMKTGTTVIGIDHLGKDKTKSVLQRLMGSTYIGGQARAVWAFIEDQEQPGRTLMLPAKMNLAPKNGGLAFRLQSVDGCDHPTLAWEADRVMVSADEALAGPDHTPREQQAMDWLRQRLGDSQEHYASEVYEDGAKAGFYDRLLQRAFKNLGGVPSKSDFRGKSVWRLPVNGHAGVALVSDCESLDGTGVPKNHKEVQTLTKKTNNVCRSLWNDGRELDE